MKGTILITGGAGFIGSHLAGDLLAADWKVRVIDNLTPQVHEDGRRPAYLHEDVEFLEGDVRDADAVRRALDGVDAVAHLAARVGVGQSMYEIAAYSSVNSAATGVLLQALLEHPVQRLLVASSMSVYGEGRYVDEHGRPQEPQERTREQLQQGRWDPVGPRGETLVPVPTTESKPPSLSSIYALGKFDQEQMCLLFGRAYDVPTTALRFFNVYGPDQALSNPYTGVLAIFAGRLLNGRPPLIFEDGNQRRDFVSVHDVARACRLGIERTERSELLLNIGSGQAVSVLEIAEQLGRVLGREQITPVVQAKYRVGDVRHCFADIAAAAEQLGYAPQVSLEQGISELAQWLEGQHPDDRVELAASELAARGLTV
jgi:dTDP-L-rhamnose 4-epimerase